MRDFPNKKRTILPTPNALNFLEVQNSKLNFANWSLKTQHDIERFVTVTSHVENISRFSRSVFSAEFSRS